MTVIYSVSTPGVAVQAGDRRITKGRVPVEERASKAILYICDDGLVCIGYTGLAYLKERATDEWIVSQLTGETSLFEDGRMSIQFGYRPLRVDLGQAVSNLADALNRVWGGLKPAEKRISIEIEIVGWQWQRRTGRDVRRLLWNVQRAKDGFRIFRHIPRRIPRAWVYLSSIGDDRLREHEFEALSEDAHRRWKEPDEIAALLVGSVQTVADRSPFVGPDATSVAMPHPANGWSQIRFHGDQQHVAVTPERPPVEIGFVPWVISPGSIVPPAAVIGETVLRLGGFEVRIDGPRPDRGLLAMWSSLPRRADSQRST